MVRVMTVSAVDAAPGAFGARLGAPAPLSVLCVDICRAYLDPASPLCAPVADAVASAARVVAAARDAGVPVVHTRVQYRPDGADGGVFFRKVPALRVFVEGSPLAAFCDDPAPRDGEVVVTKQYASAFFGTSLASTLHAWGVRTVVITGLSTSGCVRATAVDAVQNGFVPLVVRDACGDRTAGPHEAALFDLDAKYADVVGELEAIAALRQGVTR